MGLGAAAGSPSLSTYVLSLLAGATAVQLLLVPAYRSTDFEVHRNWLAITGSLPRARWYLEATSEWTLDYPPLFAWFEWLLAQAARRLEPGMLVLRAAPYASTATIWFQRSSVMATNGLLVAAVWRATVTMALGRRAALAALVLLNPGLLIVDHIHFQYNGMLLGLLLLSATLMRERRHLLAAATFAALLQLKHLFALTGPLYGVYLLRAYCVGGADFSVARFVRRLAALAAIVALISAASLGPFITQLPQLLARLFPFGRGLCHAYWAPNIWSLYNTVDKLAAAAAHRLGLPLAVPRGYLTQGLVGDGASHAVLPTVRPLAAAALVLAANAPCLLALWRHPRPQLFVRALAFVNLCGFLAGWHVHEKAILHVTLPLALLALDSRALAADYLLLSTVGHFSLHPLLYEPREWPIKHALLALYTLAAHAGLQELHGGKPLLGRWQRAYLLGLVPLEALCVVLQQQAGGRLPFLPLWLTSLYCALGIGYAWVKEAAWWARLAARRTRED